MKAEIGRCVQLIFEEISPHGPAVQEIMKYDKIVNVTRTVLGRETGQYPDQSDMDGYEANIVCGFDVK
jgi:hypothetical protein